MGKVRIAIVGVGNCASSLVQGLEYYKDADDGARVPGLMHVRFGPYHISDVEVVAAFDVDAKKVGCDLAEAIVASENNTIKIAEVPPTGVTVQRGPTMDGLGEYYREIITESDEPAVDVAQALRETGADVLVSYLPVGSEQADRYYAQCAIDAHVAFVNALPVFIASDPEWAAKFTAGRRADHRRRHQVPGRRHHHAPRAGQAVRGPRGRTAPHLPAELRRQHGLHEHAGAQAGSSRRRSPRPRRSPRRSRTRWSAPPCTSARRTTCRGWMTARWPTSGWRGARSATCRSTWSTSSRSGTRRTRPG